MTTVEVVRKGKLRLNEIHWSDGQTTQYWWVKKPLVVLFQPRSSSDVLSILPSQLGFRSFDETLFWWVNASSFQKEKTVKGKTVREYAMDKRFEDTTEHYAAEIDAETGRPLTWSNGAFKATFAFSEPPSAPLVMPENFHAALRRIAEIEAPAKRMGRR